MKIKLIASDLDGTIIDKNNNICNQNFLAIDKIHEKNLPFVICTGKSYSVSSTVCKKLKADYGIFGNGTQIVNLKEKKELARKVLKKENIDYCIKFARSQNLHIHFYTEDSIVTEELKYMDLRNYILKDENSTELKFFIVPTIEEFIEKENPNIFSLVITSEGSMLDFETEIQKNISVSTNLIIKKGEFKDFITNKEYEYLNIAPSKIDKNQGLKYLSNILNIPHENMLAIGDNVNDLEMIKNSGIGIAVADAYDEIKSIADYITKNNVSSGAFAEAINKFI
ncbi:MAG: HAD-IIB family hydrolase [Clostridia bacterium]|nr:HAD-IIB family hydrolase [Clostridia bacterium]